MEGGRASALGPLVIFVGAREQDVALRFFGEGRVSLRATCESAYQLEPLVYEMELDLFAVRAPPPRERYSLRTASFRPARAFAAGGAGESWSAPLLLRPKKPRGCPVLFASSCSMSGGGGRPSSPARASTTSGRAASKYR